MPFKIPYLNGTKVMAPPRCEYCGKAFETRRAVNHHISASRSCSRDWRNDFIKNDNPSPSPKRLKKGSLTDMEGELEGNLDVFEGVADDFDMPSPPRRASVEEDEGEGGRGNTYPTSITDRFIESYPGKAGEGLRRTKTQFEVWLKNQREEEKIPWFLFAWALTKWLLKNVGQTSTDEFLKLAIVRQVCDLKKKDSLRAIRLIAKKNYHFIIPIRF